MIPLVEWRGPTFQKNIVRGATWLEGSEEEQVDKESCQERRSLGKLNCCPVGLAKAWRTNSSGTPCCWREPCGEQLPSLGRTAVAMDLLRRVQCLAKKEGSLNEDWRSPETFWTVYLAKITVLHNISPFLSNVLETMFASLKEGEGNVKMWMASSLGLGDISIFKIYRYFFKRDMKRDHIVNIDII